ADRLAVLHPAGSEGRQSAAHGARSHPRHRQEFGLSAEPENWGAELASPSRATDHRAACGPPRCFSAGPAASSLSAVRARAGSVNERLTNLGATLLPGYSFTLIREAATVSADDLSAPRGEGQRRQQRRAGPVAVPPAVAAAAGRLGG